MIELVACLALALVIVIGSIGRRGLGVEQGQAPKTNSNVWDLPVVAVMMTMKMTMTNTIWDNNAETETTAVRSDQCEQYKCREEFYQRTWRSN